MDAAALSLSVDSTSVVKASSDLDKFAAASTRAAGASAKVGSGAGNQSGSIARLAASVQSANAKLSAIVGALDKMNGALATNAKASQGAAAANDNVAKALGNADSHVIAYTAHLAGLVAASRAASAAQSSSASAAANAGKSYGDANSHVEAYRRSLATLPPAMQQATTSAGALKANTSNIAAQFQDVGVTAFGGMSPLLIGLQQGTQLSAVFAQSGASMGSVLAGAFRQVMSAQALMTIGLVAGVAALIQMVNWAKLGQSALTGLADNLVAVAPYAAGLAAVLALAFAPQILNAIVATSLAIGRTLVAAIVAATQAMIAFAIANPFSFFVLAAAAAVAAIVLVGKAFGKDFVTPIKDGINFVIGGFVGAFNAIKKTWAMLPAAIGDAVVQAANSVIRTVDGMVNKAITSLNGLTAKIPGGAALNIGFRADSGQLANPNAGAAQKVNDIARDTIASAQKVDYVGKAIAGVTALAVSGAAKLREWAKALGAGDGKKKPGGADDAASKATKTPEADKWADLIKGADQQQRTLDQAGERIGIYGQDLARLTHEQELLNAAQDKGLTLTTAQNAELSNRAAAMAAKEYENTRRSASAAGAVAHAESMRQLEVERGAIGLTGEALTAYNYQQQLINAQLAKSVELKDIDIAKIREQAAAYAEAATANDSSRKAIDDQRKSMEANREAVKGFFTDWISGVRNGESVFKSFEKSVLNSLNKIIDKLLDQALNQMLGGGGGAGGGIGSSLSGGAGGAIGGILGTLLGKGIKDLFGGLFADGGAFGTAQKFANGGAFTNQIVNTPTLFQFANGAKFGQMGEAGPEAVMPLSRGANGKLGVAAHGGGGKPSIRMGDVHNTYKLDGAIGADGIAAMVRQGGEATVTQIKRDLQSMLQQLDTDGAFAG